MFDLRPPVVTGEDEAARREKAVAALRFQAAAWEIFQYRSPCHCCRHQCTRTVKESAGDNAR